MLLLTTNTSKATENVFIFILFFACTVVLGCTGWYLYVYIILYIYFFFIPQSNTRIDVSYIGLRMGVTSRVGIGEIYFVV